MVTKEPSPKKKWIKAAIIVIVAVAVLWGGKYAFGLWRDGRVDTDALIEDALATVAEVESYRFSVHSQLLLNNYTTAETIISGERDVDGNLHVWGQIMSTNVDIYQIGDTHYRYHPANKAWTVLDNSPLPDNALLMMEIDPLSNFAFPEQLSIEYLGRERTHNTTLYRYAIRPEGDFHRAGAYFGNFQYEVAVDRETRFFTEATMKATSWSNENGALSVLMSFADLNDAEIKITPP